MGISSLNTFFDSSFKHDCLESLSDILLSPWRIAQGYQIVSGDSSDIKKIHPIALRLFAGFAALTFLLPFTLLGITFHYLSTTHHAAYAKYVLQLSKVCPNNSLKNEEPQLEKTKQIPPSIDTLSTTATVQKAPQLMPGVFRIGSGQGTPVSLTAGCSIELSQLYSAGFAATFHTTESQEEIWELIGQICRTSDPLFFKKNFYAKRFPRFYNNLTRLHHALPGDEAAKSVKIYWNEQAEKILFPYFFDTEEANVEDLIFMISSGEGQKASFQAPTIDFTCQLQFVDIEKTKSQEIANTHPVSIPGENNPLMLRAYAFTQRFSS